MAKVKGFAYDVMVFDTENVEVTNPFSGDSIELTPEEVAVYDLTKGAEMFGQYDIVRAGIEWFRKYNAKAYMVLLD